MSTVKLSSELLKRLEASLRAQEAPVLSRFNAGLTDAEIDALTMPLGIELPEEPRIWWKWRNGATPQVDDPYDGNGCTVGPQIRIWTLAETIAARADEMELAKEIEPDDPDYWWNPVWLPFTTAPIAVDCSETVDGCCVIRNTDPMWDPNDRGPQAMASMGELVELWIHALDNRIWRWDPSVGESGGWFQDHDLVTPELRRTSQF